MVWSEPRIKGRALLNNLFVSEALYGAPGRREIIDALPADLRAQVTRGVESEQWYPERIQSALLEAIAARSGPEEVWRFGVGVGILCLPRWHRVFVGALPFGVVLRFGAAVWRRFRSSGAQRLVSHDARAITFEIVSRPSDLTLLFGPFFAAVLGATCWLRGWREIWTRVESLGGGDFRYEARRGMATGVPASWVSIDPLVASLPVGQASHRLTTPSS